MIDLYLDNLLAFFEAGGSVLFLVFLLSLSLWTLLIERFVYIHFGYTKDKELLLQEILSLPDTIGFKDEIKRSSVEEFSRKLNTGVSFIKTLIMVCPLIGLLGTVTGMIEVFDVMAITGTSNAKSMANGVSMATIPTMAGMVVALSGILFEKKLESSIKYKKETLELELSKVI